MSEFSISSEWVEVPDKSFVGATIADLTIFVGRVAVTQNKSEYDAPSEALEVPTYFLAEWFAENWWALLFEPKKNDEVDEASDNYSQRHNSLSAQNGFSLPEIEFVPNDDNVHILAKKRFARPSGVEFTNRANAILKRSDFERTLKDFVNSVVLRLRSRSIEDTALQEYWTLVKETEADEVQYCQLIGALGLSPYDDHENIDRAIDAFSRNFGFDLTLDLCLASRPEQFLKEALEVSHMLLEAKPFNTIDLAPILGAAFPKDMETAAPWVRGVKCAQRLREYLSIDDTDPSGSDRVFQTVGIVDSGSDNLGDHGKILEQPLIVGSTSRHECSADIWIRRRKEVQRRFSVARGLYDALVLPVGKSKLLTQAVTREQQASRAFAAELLAPKNLLRSASEDRELSWDHVMDLSSSLKASPDLIRKQAENNGLTVYRSH